MRKTTKLVVTILLILLVSSMAMVFVGCDKDDITRIEILLVDVHTGKTYSSSRNLDCYIKVKLDEFEGFELKYKYKDKDKYLPDKKLSLEFLNSLTRKMVVDDERRGTVVDEIDWPREKGEYHFAIKFNKTYFDEKTNKWIENIEGYNSISYMFDLIIE